MHISIYGKLIPLLASYAPMWHMDDKLLNMAGLMDIGLDVPFFRRCSSLKPY